MNRREFEFRKKFSKKISKLKGKEAKNLFNKIEEILYCEDINHYKNLRKDLKIYKRVHVNGSYVILFCDINNVVHFVDYDHHDKIYLL
jgi:mRNA-degrading endonuclease RelE of RelBE toxin-antitoxin system